MEKWVWTEKVTDVEQRYRLDYALGEKDANGTFKPKQVPTGWWASFSDHTSFRCAPPETEEADVGVKVGDRVKFTVEVCV